VPVLEPSGRPLRPTELLDLLGPASRCSAHILAHVWVTPEHLRRTPHISLHLCLDRGLRT
jgi:hypothetical protein